MATPIKFLTGIDFNGQRATNAADASAPTDLPTLQQMQAFLRGLDHKDSVRAASTANLTITAPGASIDGVAMVAGDRFLARMQTAGAENGIYVWNGAAVAATRANDADASAKINAGMVVTSTEGTANNDKAWVLTTNDPIVLGTTALSFTQLGGASTPYTAGWGLALVGQEFAAVADNGIMVTASGIKVDPSVVTRKYAADCANATNPQTFTHGLGSDDVDITVWEGNTKVFPGVTKGSGTVIVDWGSAPTAAQYRVVVKV